MLPTRAGEIGAISQPSIAITIATPTKASEARFNQSPGCGLVRRSDFLLSAFALSQKSFRKPEHDPKLAVAGQQ